MKTVKSCLIMASAATFGIGIAWATSPHFIFASDSLNFDNGNLTCSWKEAGLGNNQLVTYICGASATATFVCVNGGKKNPSAANKTNVSENVSAEGTFNSGKNGQITASLVIEPPGSGDFTCPPGQDLELAQVSYTSVVLTDTTNNVSTPLADQSTGCLLPDVKDAC